MPRVATKPAAAKPAATPGRKEYPLLADLPKVPIYKINPRTGKPLTQPVKKKDDSGSIITVHEPVYFDANEELLHRNRFGEVLKYKLKIHKKEKSEKRKTITVNNHIYTVLRGVEVEVPWFVIFAMRDRIERHYDPEVNPETGRATIVVEDRPADTFDCRPVDACDDYDDEAAYKGVAPEETEDADLAHLGQGQEEQLVARA